MCRYWKTIDGISKISFGAKHIYGISKPEYCELILNNPKAQGKALFYRYINDMIGPGLITAER